MSNSNLTEEQVGEAAEQQKETPAQGQEVPPAKEETERKYCFTKRCSDIWAKEFSFTFNDHNLGRRLQFVDVPKNGFYWLANKIGRPLDVDDIFGPIIQLGELVKSIVPTIKNDEEVYPEIREFSCILLNIRDFDNWPDFHGGQVTVEYISQICQQWMDGHYLEGRPRRLGRYILFPRIGAQPLHGKIFSPDLRARQEFGHQASEDRDWMGGWQFSPSVGSPIGQATIALMEKLGKNDLIPMPKDDVEALLKAMQEQTKDGGQKMTARVQKANPQLAALLGLDEEEPRCGGNNQDNRGGRRNKFFFQGGGRRR